MFYLYLVWDLLSIRHVGVVTLCNDVCEECGYVMFYDNYEISGRLAHCAATGTLIQGKFTGCHVFRLSILPILRRLSLGLLVSFYLDPSIRC